MAHKFSTAVPVGIRLAGVLLAHDDRARKHETRLSGRPNIYRIAHWLGALHAAEANPSGLTAGLMAEFEHSRLRDALLKEVNRG